MTKGVDVGCGAVSQPTVELGRVLELLAALAGHHCVLAAEFVESGHVDRRYWFGTDGMLPDVLTQGSVGREALVDCCLKGIWNICHEEPIPWSFKEHRDEIDAIWLEEVASHLCCQARSPPAP